jgi:succinate dehydrogenase / fumarate reductase cytochrome b subunit
MSQLIMSSRPLSPHLQIYRPQLTSIVSITHRATGIFLSAGVLVLTYWLVSIAAGDNAYAAARECLGSVPGQLFLAAWSFSFYFHLCNGLRHLFWDVGIGFELKIVYASGYAVIAVSVAMTALTWGWVLSQGGVH